MPFFAYKGRNSRGELMEGVLEGADSGAVADQLFGTGVTPVDIRATSRAVSASGGEQEDVNAGAGAYAHVVIAFRANVQGL